MNNYRATMLACLSMLVAVVALLIALAPRLPSALGASPQQATVNQSVGAAAAKATVQRAFNYQGILRKQDGTLADGTFSMTFRLWDAVTGGNQKYSETQTGVTVRNGIFNVVLGDNGSNTGGIGTDVLAISPLFLGIAVGSDAEMQPRQRINPVPMALTLAPGATIGGDLTVQGTVNTGKIGVGGLIFIGQDNRSLLLDASRGDAQYIFSPQDIHVDSGADHSLVLNTGVDTKDIIMGNGSHVVQINGSLRVNGRPPILIRRYFNAGNDANFDTGILSSDYHCSTGGSEAFYDIILKSINK